MEDPESGRPLKRFKHQSHAASLRAVHLPSASAYSRFDDDISDLESHFYNALGHWRQLNLSPTFVRFVGQVQALSSSMPLLLHHCEEIICFWIEAVKQSDDDGLKVLFDLLQKLVHDLRSALLPSYIPLLEVLLDSLAKTLTAETLTSLLTTLSQFFKHLLNPSTPLLAETWSSLCSVLPRCNAEVQRATAEVWASVLRRCKGGSRETAVSLITQGLESIEDACAWMLICTLKSVSHTLHTCTSALFSALLSTHLSSTDRTRTETLMKRVITSLAHHCDKAEQFLPISDVLLARFTAISSDDDELPFVMELVSVACSVRRGSRMTQKQLSTILSRLAQNQLSPDYRGHVFTLSTAVLLAGDMTVWMGAGRKFLELSWEDNPLGLQLSGALSELEWGGWRLIELPFTLKHSARLIDTHPITTLTLLAVLAKAGRLEDVDEIWLGRIAASVQKRLDSWNLNEEKKRELECILSLSPLLPSITPCLVRIANMALEASEKQGGSNVHDETHAFTGAIFGSCLKALANSLNQEWTKEIDASFWVTRAVRNWGWCEPAIEGLTTILRKEGTAAIRIPMTQVYPYLQENLLSHSRDLRRVTLELLTTTVLERTRSHEVIKRCLQGEDVSLDVQGVRERILRITGVSQFLGDEDTFGADICARWLIAQLKVNLRPLWAPAVKALEVLSQRFGEYVWNLAFVEIERVVRGGFMSISEASSVPEHANTEKEVERSWRDPSAFKLRSIVDKWSQGTAGPSHTSKARPDRLDVANYEIQLLHALGEMAILTRKHNAELVRLFLSFASPELPSKPSRKKLSSWLVLFSKLDNPKAFHQSHTLLSLYHSLLSHPDRDLQLIALTCIMNYKSPHLIPYEANLRGILDNTRWKDELTTFSISDLEEGDRREVVNIVVRLFFGMMLERHGRFKGTDRRASLLGALGGCREEELKTLVELMLEPLGLSSTSLDTEESLSIDSSEKQQKGFLILLGDVLKRLGSRLMAYWPHLLTATIKVTSQAQKSLAVVPDNVEDDDIGDDDIEVDEHPGNAPAQPPSKSRSTRTIRQLGIKRFTNFFDCDAAFDFRPYIPLAFSTFISPRLTALEHENTQAPSAILELFRAWSMRRDFVHFLVEHDDRILPKTYACLQSVNVKPSVVSLIFDITENILAMSVDDSDVAERVLKPHVSSLLNALTVQRPTPPGARNDLLHRQVGILSQVAQFVSDAPQALRLLQHFLPLLKQPHKVIPEKTKIHLLKVVQGIIPVVPDFQDQAGAAYLQTYDLLSKLFQNLRGRLARVALLEAFNQFSTISTDLQRISGLLASLNAFSLKRIDEPDFNCRMQAFTSLNEDLYQKLSPKEWQPILFNMLQFIQDPDELAVRTNAAFSLKKFIDILSSGENQEIRALFIRVLYPGLKSGLLSKTEPVRNEILGVLAYGVLKCDSVAPLKELRPFLANGDEEANFFNNVHHIQIHRRTRAIRRLVEYVESGILRSTTIAEIFVPLIGHFITNASTTDHILVDVTIAATGSMARHLPWGAYNTLVRQYMKLIKEKPPAMRACVRVLVAILENFHFPMDDVVLENESAAQELYENAHGEVALPPEDIPIELQKSIKGMPMKKMVDVVNTRLLPTLLQHLERRDDNEDALRIPIAIGIVQVVRHLPKATREAQISRLLTILCQIFRSKSHETRAFARETLCKIAVILGPPHLHPIITELRAALVRGPHLHVLATVVHALIVHVTSPSVVPSYNLDVCAADIAHISAEVIFGQSGRDMHSEGFKTTMIEVRGSSSKGLDAFSLLAKYVTPPSISTLLMPIRGIMRETGSSKTLQIVDDLLRRISGSLNMNTHLTPSEHLLLCHTLIQQDSRFLKETPTLVKGNSKPSGLFTVQMKRHLDQNEGHYVHNAFRFVAFGLGLFTTAFRRGRFDLKDPQIISRLEPMVAVIGNTLFSQEAPVVIQGLKATAAIVNCPLKSIEKSLPVFLRQTIDIIRQAGNTESELVQSAFRTLAVIIRDCPASKVQEKELVYLLELLSPDLEEPNRQAAVFGLLRAIVSRKFVAAEIYDIMDKVAEIMVTNQSTQVQEMCRAVFLQFLLDYPQGKGRLRNKMTFLAQNLSYTYESGRLSVMELLNAIFSKFQPEIVREYADLFFVALVMVIANDDSSKCREMAAELIKLLFSHLDVAGRRTVVSHLHSWSSQKTRIQLSRVSTQVYGLVIDTLQKETHPYLPGLLEDINEVLQRSAGELRELESNIDGSSMMDIDVEWQLPYHALNVVSKVLRVHPGLTKEVNKIDWSAIGTHLLFPHAWVRNASSRLVGLLFNAIPPGTANPGATDDGLTSLSGLIDVARKSSLQLKSDTLDSSLSLQVVKNLFYIGKYFYSILKPRPMEATVEPDQEASGAQGDDAEHEAEDKSENIRSNPLHWLFSKLSYQARSAWIVRRNQPVGRDNWSEQPLAIFRWFAAMASHMELAALETFLVHILSPVYRIVDDSTVRDAQIEELKALAQELVELLQNRVGASRFASVYNQIRQGIVAVRRERKTERAIQATLRPQASAHRKIKRNLAKKDNRARKNRLFADGKIRNNRIKKRRATA